MKQKSITFVKYDMIKKSFVLAFLLSISFTQDKLILQQADLLESSVINNETITQLSGNIIFKKNDTVLKSDFATQYAKSPLVKLNNNVVIKKESQTIYCDSLTYNQDSQLFSMYGNVRIDDKQRSMQSNKALLNEKTEQITLIENCQINENNNCLLYTSPSPRD